MLQATTISREVQTGLKSMLLTWHRACGLLQIIVIPYLQGYKAAVEKQKSQQRLNHEAVISQLKRKIISAAVTRAEGVE